ncbi:KipI antagonist [Cytophagales bacterium WSM2-2]|nr:KipI antagonist [Cytophagales bacterium WSM2-2]
MSIRILKPSLLTSLVANRREGFRSWGIGPGGAMDHFAFHVANYLVGNENESVIEFGYSSAEILFEKNYLVCVTGKGYTVQVDGIDFPLWKPLKIASDSKLSLTKTSKGAWAYMAVHGGWRAQAWLGSETTNLSAISGGFQGKLIQKNDVIEGNLSVPIAKSQALTWGISTRELNQVYSPVDEIRCMSSIETDLLSEVTEQKFFTEDFILSSQSNRMGYRMQGPRLSLKQPVELVSSPVDFGTIQLLPDGNIIVLMADHQTTGGYPRIASVIKADLPRLAQAFPGEKIKFIRIAFSDAEDFMNSEKNRLAELKRSCHLQFKNSIQL